MKYEIWLGNTGLYGVESVEESADRKIAVYDSVGAGKFPQAESRGLKSWEIKCELTEPDDRHLPNWIAASEVFDDLASMMNKKTPARLVIRSDYGKTSERVLLKSFTKVETVSGVFIVNLSCIEYVEAAVKTADVPYVARPGKVPELPKTATISDKGDGGGMTPYALMVQAKRTENSPYGPLDVKTKHFSSAEDAAAYIASTTFLDPETLKPRNPAALKEGDTVEIDYKRTSVLLTAGAYIKAVGRGGKLFPAFLEIDKALREYDSQFVVYK